MTKYVFRLHLKDSSCFWSTSHNLGLPVTNLWAAAAHEGCCSHKSGPAPWAGCGEGCHLSCGWSSSPHKPFLSPANQVNGSARMGASVLQRIESVTDWGIAKITVMNWPATVLIVRCTSFCIFVQRRAKRVCVSTNIHGIFVMVQSIAAITVMKLQNTTTATIEWIVRTAVMSWDVQ